MVETSPPPIIPFLSSRTRRPLVDTVSNRSEIFSEDVSLLTPTTIASLAALLAIIGSAYTASVRLLPAHTTPKLRAFYIWHLADALVHLVLEASFLYNCFLSYAVLPALSADYPHPASLGSAAATPLPHFLGRADRAYGSAYGSNPLAALWRDYAKADKRWARADPTVVSLEVLTVVLGGPIALYVYELIRRGAGGREGGEGSGKMWFWDSLLATGELYGGFMTVS